MRPVWHLMVLPALFAVACGEPGTLTDVELTIADCGAASCPASTPLLVGSSVNVRAIYQATGDVPPLALVSLDPSFEVVGGGAPDRWQVRARHAGATTLELRDEAGALTSVELTSVEPDELRFAIDGDAVTQAQVVQGEQQVVLASGRLTIDVSGAHVTGPVMGRPGNDGSVSFVFSPGLVVERREAHTVTLQVPAGEHELRAIWLSTSPVRRSLRLVAR